jgi:hypothetical protein
LLVQVRFGPVCSFLDMTLRFQYGKRVSKNDMNELGNTTFFLYFFVFFFFFAFEFCQLREKKICRKGLFWGTDELFLVLFNVLACFFKLARFLFTFVSKGPVFQLECEAFCLIVYLCVVLPYFCFSSLLILNC